MQKRTITCKGITIGEGIPKIAVPLVARDAQELEAALDALQGQPFDLVEFRADFYAQIESKVEDVLGKIRSVLPQTPILFTFRTKREGGERDIAFADYAQLNLAAAGSGHVDLVDVELGEDAEQSAHLTEQLHAAGVYVVGSYHNFDYTPARDYLAGKVAAMQKAGMDITKFAVMPKTRQDVADFFATCVYIDEQIADRPLVSMSMGCLGLLSRLGGDLSGSAVTFAAVGKVSAPGQIKSSDLQTVLNIIAAS